MGKTNSQEPKDNSNSKKASEDSASDIDYSATAGHTQNTQRGGGGIAWMYKLLAGSGERPIVPDDLDDPNSGNTGSQIVSDGEKVFNPSSTSKPANSPPSPDTDIVNRRKPPEPPITVNRWQQWNGWLQQQNLWVLITTVFLLTILTAIGSYSLTSFFRSTPSDQPRIQ